MKRIIAASLLLLTLTACSATLSPTTPVAQLATQTITVSATPSPLPPSQTPDSQPTAEWNGIPIMPGAIAGEGDEEGYVFTIKATSQEVQGYYQLELAKRGWQLLGEETSDASTMLSFMDSNSATLTVSILSKGEDILVILVK